MIRCNYFVVQKNCRNNKASCNDNTVTRAGDKAVQSDFMERQGAVVYEDMPEFGYSEVPHILLLFSSFSGL